MRSTLYYPHTTVKNEDLINTALLLWDRLEYIVPDPFFQPHYKRRDLATAIELVGVQRIPNEHEKQEAHARLKEVVSRKLPPQFYFSRRPEQNAAEHYEIYPEKLLDESWELLRQARISGRLLQNSDYSLSEFGGLLIMSILADCCAGTTRSRITDRGVAYATLADFSETIPLGQE
jgi:hypothetical protein